MKKQCSNCREWKDESEFQKHSHNQDGLQSGCKKCRKNYYQEHKEQSKSAYQRWLTKNREKNQQYQKVYKDGKRFGGNRLKVLRRDNYTCQVCGKHTNLVHHKDGSGVRSKYPTALFPNNSPEDLIVVCKSCHNKIHKTKEVINGLCTTSHL